MTKKELSKCREWEKERRDRLKTCFTALSRVLPNYDPSIVLSKLEILQKAANCITELTSKNRELLSGDVNKENAKSLEVKKLEGQVVKLQNRIQQLVNLLHDAGIKIPTECGVAQKFKEPRRWSNKIPPEQARILLENERKRKKLKKIIKKRKLVGAENGQITVCKRTKKLTPRNVASKKTLREKNASVITQFILQPNNGLTVLQPNRIQTSQPITIVNNINSQQQFKEKRTTFKPSNISIINSLPATASVQTTKINSVIPQINPSINTFGPGTLILANGELIPVIQPASNIIQPTQALVAPPILMNAPANNNSTIVLVPSKNQKAEVVLSKSVLPVIKPRIGITKTTTVNKVPIPAISSRNYLPNLPTNKNAASQAGTKRSKTSTIKLKSVAKETNKKAVQKKKVLQKSVAETNPVASTEPTRRASDEDNSKTVTVGHSIEEICKEIGNDKQEILPQTSNCAVVGERTAVESVVKGKGMPVEKNTEQIVESVAASKNIENTETQTLKELSSTNTEICELSKSCDSLNLPHSELSNDLFASLQVPTGSHHPESISPTAAFLLAFPLVSTLTGGKVAETIEEENSESQQGTPTLLQIGSMESSIKPAITDNITPNLLSLDTLTFFSSSKDVCNSFYSAFDTTLSNPPSKPETGLKKKDVKARAVEEKRCVEAQSKTMALCAEITANSNEKSKLQPSLNCDFSNLSNYHSKNDIFSFDVSFGTVNTAAPNNAPRIFNEKSKPVDKNVFEPFEPKNDLKKIPDTNNLLRESHQLPAFNNQPLSSAAPKILADIALPKNTIQNANSCSHSFSTNVNTFNPFTDLHSNFSAQASSAKTYCGEALYTNSSTYSYNCTNDQQKGKSSKPSSSTYGYQEISVSKTRTDVPNYFINYNLQKEKQSLNVPEQKTAGKQNGSCQVRPPYNWMTTPDIRQPQTSDFLLPPFGKELEYCQNNMFSASSLATTAQSTFYSSATSAYSSSDLNNTNLSDNRKPLDQPYHMYQKPDVQTEENQFSWSPTKLPPLLDSHHNMLVPSTLPTLIGDLALNTTTISSLGVETTPKRNEVAGKSKEKQMPMQYSTTSSSSFLSVSQLVDQNKTDSMRIGARRNSGNRNMKAIGAQKAKKLKVSEAKDQCYSEPKPADRQKLDWPFNSKSNRCNTLNYSAESLIGNASQLEMGNFSRDSQPTKPHILPSFANDNIMPYFTPVDLPNQDTTTYIQKPSQNYQTNNFSQELSKQSSVYSTGIPSHKPNFVPISDINTNEYNTVHHDPNIFYPTIPNRLDKQPYNLKNQAKDSRPQRNVQQMGASGSFARKNTKRTKSIEVPASVGSTGSSVSTFPDINFLSMPTAMNSPMLASDDFHNPFISSSNAQLYPPTTQNSLYPKPFASTTSDLNSSAPLLTSLPSIPRNNSIVDSSNMGTSLTNFNLSTIFPEINKNNFSISSQYNDNSKKDISLKPLPSHIGVLNSDIDFNKTNYQSGGNVQTNHNHPFNY